MEEGDCPAADVVAWSRLSKSFLNLCSTCRLNNMVVSDLNYYRILKPSRFIIVRYIKMLHK